MPPCWYDTLMVSELGRIGPFVIRTYTLFLDLAILAGLGILTWEGWRIDDEPVEWIDSGLAALVSGIILGRLGHVVVHWGYFYEHANEIMQVWRGGLDWHGAVIGGMIALAISCAVRRLSFRRMMDVMAFILPLGTVLVYAGCSMASCGHGREVASLADYPPYLVAEWPDLYGIVAPRFASQRYGVGLGVVLLLVAGLLSRLLRRPGVRFWPVLALLGLGAFGIGFTRGDSVPSAGALRLDQVLDLAVVGLGLVGTVLAMWPNRLEGPVEASEA